MMSVSHWDPKFTKAVKHPNERSPVRKSGLGQCSFACRWASQEDMALALPPMVSTQGALSISVSRTSEDCRVFKPDGELKLGNWRKSCAESQLKEAVEALDLLLDRGSCVDISLLFSVLKKCTAQKNLVLSKRVHALSRKSGHETNEFLATQLIRMYSSHGRLEEATEVFTSVAAPNTFMWCSLISAYAEHGQPAQALKLYRQMCQSPVEPNSHVFLAVIKACAAAGDLASGKEVHADILERGVALDLKLGSCLLDMYSKCGSIENARSVFDGLPNRDVVTWTAMISGYARNGLGQVALTLYESMRQQGMSPANEATFVSLLKACANIGALQEGKQLHAQIKQRGLEDDVVVGNCLMDMYIKCGCIEEARRVFDCLPTRDVVTWTAMIAAYAQHGPGQEALTLFARMQRDGLAPADPFTFACLLKACSNVGALHQGMQLHAQIQQLGLDADVVVGNCLVEMYSKCGSLNDARQVFQTLPTRSVVTWTALLNGYAEHSNGQAALQCFHDMLQEGVKPDDATFSCLLVAFSHEGMLSEAQHYFKKMVEFHGITPTVKHYNCIVDLLGRSGHLDEAEAMLQTLPFDSDVVGWTALLSACKSHGDIERGRRCFDYIVQLDPQNATAYVLLGNIYANAGMWRDVDRIESLRKGTGAVKKPAKACIEVKDKVHEFVVGQDASDASSKLRSTYVRLKQEGGHLPHTELVLHGGSAALKEDALCGHAEKLALAYGLLNTPGGTPLRVTKNLRMCNDCHSGTKVMSRLEKREIIVRDSHRVHHFEDGSCSCRDRH